MKTYQLLRHPERLHECTLYVIDPEAPEHRRIVPMVIGDGNAGFARWPMGTVAMSLLLDYFEGEENAEVKAFVLSRSLANELSWMNARKLYQAGKQDWKLTEAQLGEMICKLMLNAKRNVDAEQFAEEIVVLEAAGQRRDQLREAARLESVPTRGRKVLIQKKAARARRK